MRGPPRRRRGAENAPVAQGDRQSVIAAIVRRRGEGGGGERRPPPPSGTRRLDASSRGRNTEKGRA